MIVVLSKLKHQATILRTLPKAKLVEDLKHLSGGECLIGYGTGLIVPAEIIQQFQRAYNFHGASPLYPGRDPHHWAAYEGARQFGATAHVMTALVDDGPIVGSLLKTVPEGATPDDYRTIGEQTMEELFSQVAPLMAKGPLAPTGIKWGLNKRARSHTIAMCTFDGLDEAEIAKRRSAFKGFEPHFRSAQPAT